MADLTKMEHAFDRFEAALRRVEVAMLRSQERDARAKLVAGADLVQVYTGLIYKGPALVSECARALARP